MKKSIVLVGIFLMSSLMVFPVQGSVIQPDFTPNQRHSVTFSSYLGGSSLETVRDMVITSDGSVILYGRTESSNLHVTSDAYQDEYAGGGDLYLAMISPTGNLDYLSYFGGSDTDIYSSVTLDNTGAIIITGFTESSDFPLIDPLFPSLNGTNDMFVAKFHSNGTPIFSTLIGGTGSDWGYGICVDSNDDILLTGHVTSNDFPTTGDAFQPARGGGEDAVVVKLSSDGQELLFSSYLGGDNEDMGLNALVDNNDRLVVVGLTSSDNFPIGNAYQSEIGGAMDAFITVIDSNGSLVWSSFLGGDGDDGFWGISAMSNGNYVAVGRTESTDLSTTASAPQSSLNGSGDVLISSFTPEGSLSMLTYLGGSSYEHGWDIVVDTDDDIILIGETRSDNYPVISAAQGERGGYTDGFVTKLSGQNDSILYSSFYGSDGNDIVRTVGVVQNEIVVAGFTTSDNLVTTGAFQAAYGGGQDAFIATYTPLSVPLTPTTPDGLPTYDRDLFLNIVMIVAVLGLIGAWYTRRKYREPRLYR